MTWIYFNTSESVPFGRRLLVKLKSGAEKVAIWERRGTVTAWWDDAGEPTGLYNVVAYASVFDRLMAEFSEAPRGETRNDRNSERAGLHGDGRSG